MENKKKLIELLHAGNYSCVIAQGNDTRTFRKKGVKDLYELLCHNPAFLKGAYIADKVVGKAAAALMIRGGIKDVYTDTISLSALTLLRKAHISVDFERLVPYIQNPDKTGWCPLEEKCYHEDSVDGIFDIVRQFIRRQMPFIKRLFMKY